MAKGSSTTAELPPELRPLVSNTATTMGNLQRYFWGNLSPNIGGSYTSSATAPSTSGTPTTTTMEASGGGTPVIYPPLPALSGFFPSIMQYEGKYVPEMAPEYDRIRTGVDELLKRPNPETLANELVGVNYENSLRPYTLTESDPLIAAQKQLFQNVASPQISRAMTQAGLGRSGAEAQALSKGWAGMLPGATAQSLAAQQTQRNQMSDALKSGMQTYLTTGGRETDRINMAGNWLSKVGDAWRQAETEKGQSSYDNFLRMQALAEQSLFGPFGLSPSTIGSRTGKA